MSSIYDKYTAVIGLEVHIQLLTKSKAFSSDMNEYGSLPNSNVSPISLGHPGTLPVLNENSVNFAIRLGLACNCDITRDMHFARKNYFYADLPKGYQITQDDTPICTGGTIEIQLENGNTKSINLTRIHIEEDSGKSMHDQDAHDSLVDLNRAGVPLLEMVSEPEIASSEEAYQYLTEVRKLVRYLDICDGNMEEGSMRCDANVSVMPKGTTTFGTRTEVKNMNSVRNVQRAIESEIKRHIEVIESGNPILQETRSFNAVDGSTTAMRSKADAHDYRYFPEPDLQPLHITQEVIDEVKKHLPPLPNELIKKYTTTLGLSDYDARVITDNKAIALYFEGIIEHTDKHKSAANWLTGAVKSHLNSHALTIEKFPLAPQRIAELIVLIDEGKVSNSLASQKLFPAMLEAPEQTPEALAEKDNWIQNADSGLLTAYIEQAMAKFPDKVAAYRAGNKNLLGLFMGEVMKLSKGTADPKAVNQLMREKLEQE